MLYLLKLSKTTQIIIIIFLFILTNGYAEQGSIKLLYVSVLPDIETRETTGGIAELGTAVKEYRKTEENFIFLHGGASLAPSIIIT